MFVAGSSSMPKLPNALRIVAVLRDLCKVEGQTESTLCNVQEHTESMNFQG
jgi:hypothetical protein